MKTSHLISRRNFFKISLATAGLAIGFKLEGCSRYDQKQTEGGIFSPDVYLKITPDNQVTIVVIEAEMGQGVWTSLPMLIAEELELDWTTVQIERVPVLPEFRDNITWGSSSVYKAWKPLRQAGAIARQMLLSAASESWQVPVNECSAINSVVTHHASGMTASYGDLVVAAANLPIPETVTLKDPDQFRIIGTSVIQLDAPDKCSGVTEFGTDIKLEGMLTATVVHCPVFGGTLKTLDATEALGLPGVRHVVPIDTGVAVTADHFWAAKKGVDALKIQWDPGPNSRISSVSIRDTYSRAIKGKAEVLKQHGDLGEITRIDKRMINATFEVPYQAHATMEPMCCTADVKGRSCDIWVPTQAPGRAQLTAASYLLSKPEHLMERLKEKFTGSSLEQIRVNTTFLGGGFGRRVEQDFVAEAVQISQAIAKPVKLIWSREEDMQHDYYRPYTLHQVSAGVDTEGNLLTWKHRIAGPRGFLSTNGADLPYKSTHFRLEYVQTESPAPIGLWRSVAFSHNVFVIETFIDELAEVSGVDNYAFRHHLLDDLPRLQAVMDLAAEKAGWGNALSEGRFRGIAVSRSHGSFVSQVVEISLGNKLKVHRVICAVDCGQVINPDTIRAQMEGSIVFGLSACIKGSITIKNGQVQQSNFHDFPLLRMDEMPVIETYIIPSKASPGGVGEIGVPTIAPAVANAVYAATGKRVRKLPITQDDLAA